AYITKNYTTDVLIDLATLTGSVVRMFGEKCAAYFSNNPLLKNRLEASAERTGQKIWNLPLWEDWSEEIKSDVADLKNISLLPNSDCIVAAKFLEQFIDGHTNWAHLDIAGVAFTKVDYMQESAATGYGVRLLLDLIENLTPDTN
ncbi:MAG: leucyl aminopeptidase family protein, partial [Weeksellaceae bacterium]|nr:leucyl aminopeptidase family protein [Weeksellaceae bacterium]